MEDDELARRAYALPDRFKDRLSARTFEHVRSAARAGEWDEEIDILLAGLQKNESTISAAERDETQALLDAMGESSERLDQQPVMALPLTDELARSSGDVCHSGDGSSI
jgi:hypothetical protein